MDQKKSEGFNSDSFRVSADLVAVHMQAETMEEVITRLSGLLIAHGYVRPSYTQSAIEREETCPTGLPTPRIGTAIPHGGVEHTIKPGIAIATLVRPVKFGELGDPTSQVEVSVVFLLSVTQPEAQVYLLQSIVDVYKDEESLRRLYTATDPSVIVHEVNAALAQTTDKRSAQEL